MRILHVNDVATVGSILVRSSRGRDALYQPALRRDIDDGRLAAGRLALRRVGDVVRLRQAFRTGGFTHLHVHYATFAYLADLAGISYSLHVHGGDVLLDLDRQLKRHLVSRALRRARRVAVSTPDLLLPTQALRPDAVYIANPMEIPPGMRAWPQSQRPRIALLSKMDQLKGWPEQVALLEALVRRLPEMEVSFLAHGQLPDQERERLSNRLYALGGRVTPPLSAEAFLRHVADHHFALGQLEVGSLGMSEMQAMALGVPTIARASAHVSIGNRPPVIPPDEAPARVHALWVEGAEASAQWGQEARAFLTKYHHPEQSLRTLESLLSETTERL